MIVEYISESCIDRRQKEYKDPCLWHKRRDPFDEQGEWKEKQAPQCQRNGGQRESIHIPFSRQRASQQSIGSVAQQPHRHNHQTQRLPCREPGREKKEPTEYSNDHPTQLQARRQFLEPDNSRSQNQRSEEHTS